MFMALTEIVANVEELSFSSEQSKLDYLGRVLSTFKNIGSRIPEPKRVNYKFEIHNADGEELYPGGMFGSLRMASSSFARDIICVKNILRVSNPEFDQKIFDYVNELESLGFVHAPDIILKSSVPYENYHSGDPVLDAARAPRMFIDETEKNFYKRWAPRIKYHDISRIKSEIRISVD